MSKGKTGRSGSFASRCLGAMCHGMHVLVCDTCVRRDMACAATQESTPVWSEGIKGPGLHCLYQTNENKESQRQRVIIEDTKPSFVRRSTVCVV